MKKLLKMILSVAVLCFGVLSAMAYPDVDESHWAYSQIKLLTEQGVIIGYPDGTFKPDENVTRAEFAAMAIRALGQEHTKVAQPVHFTDITQDHWAYEDIQKALYFDLISCDKNGELFRPDDSVSRGETITVAVNALTTETITKEKALEVLSQKYADAKIVEEWFIIPAGKAEILEMIVVMPSAEKKLEASRPATRAEVAAILFNMMEQAKLNPNAKLAEAMRKKTGDGFVIEDATVQGSVGTIPAGTTVPIRLNSYISTQTTQNGVFYTARVPQNYVTKDDHYILIREGASLRGQILDVQPGKYFVRNGVLVLKNSLITTENDQIAPFVGLAEVKKDRNWWMKFVRWAFKGEQLEVMTDGYAYMKLLKPLRVDLTNGWIYED
ncbi:S-layer homology domain-containing protein [bacterium]|nr:S-layer homology domain-containing protein [bacterium]